MKRNWFLELIDFIYPNACSGCGNPLVDGEEILCLQCHLELPKTHIKDFSDNQVQRVFTGRCDFRKATAMYAFQKGGVLQNALHHIKYKGDKDCAQLLGSMAGRHLHKLHFFEGIDIIVPVPLHPKKLKKRGYNQSTEIASGILKQVSGLEMNEAILKRDVHNASQTKKGRFNRWLNVEHIFALGDDAHNYEGKHILLFDDVVTTGATVEAAYNKLIYIRNVRVSFLALAVA